MRRAILTAAVAIAVLAAAPAWSQGIGDLSGTSPCCAKMCSGGTSTSCGDLVPTGLSHMLSGCAGLEPPANPTLCVGGQLLDSTPPALVDGCVCLLGTCFGPLSTQFAQLTPEQCTAQSIRACGEAGNVVVTPNDPACSGCAPPKMECNGMCVDTSNDPDNCGGCGIQCGSGQGCQNGICVECRNHSGGGDNTNPGGGGNPAGCNNPGGSR